MAVRVVAVTTKVIGGIHMTSTNDSRGSGSVGKRYKWHLHMTKADGSRGSGSDDKRDQ